MTAGPAFLTSAGEAAYLAAIAAVNQRDPLQVDGAERYARAADRAAYARAEWEAAGSPLMIRHSNGTVGAAPALRVLRDLEADAARYLLALRPRPRIGRPALNEGLVTGTPATGMEAPAAPPPRLRLARPGRAS